MAVGKEQVDKFWVVGVPAPVFSDDPMLSIKAEFESSFRTFHEEVQFSYIKPLSRVLVTYPDEESCQRALHSLKNTEFQGVNLKVHPVKPVTIGERKLSLPERTKQFLISPPASPPVGWEPLEEQSPLIDYNLLAALSQLRNSGETHEVLPASGSVPGIVISSDELQDPIESTTQECISTPSVVNVHTQRPPMDH